MDDDVLALNKPPGLAVQGGTKTARRLDAMLDALKFKAVERPRLVHHLDKDTSSLLLLARALPPQGHSPLHFGSAACARSTGPRSSAPRAAPGPSNATS